MKDELLDETELYPFAEDEKGVSFLVRLVCAPETPERSKRKLRRALQHTDLSRLTGA